jgi:threonine dehydrogenase-like Zn-dependent dehydrogenase
MAGGFELPIKYGYSLVGVSDADDVLHCMHPHQATAYVAPDSIFIAPSGIPARRLALLSNLETAVTATWDAGSLDVDRIAILGFGSIGSLLAMALRLLKNTDPLIIESDPWKQSRAAALGFEAVSPANSHSELDLCFNTTGNPAALQWSIDNAAPEAMIVESSWYGDQPISLDLGGRFHRNRVRIVSTQVSKIPRAMSGNFDFSSRKKLCADLLTDQSFDSLISEEIAFQDTPKFFSDLRRDTQGDGIIWLIRY